MVTGISSSQDNDDQVRAGRKTALAFKQISPSEYVFLRPGLGRLQQETNTQRTQAGGRRLFIEKASGMSRI